MRPHHRISMRQLAVLALCLCALPSLRAADGPSAAAPDFTLESSGGGAVTLSELRGRVVLINFWASWCGPCRQEMPLLDQLFRQHEPLGFTVLGVNVDEDPRRARSVLSKIPVSFPIVFDGANAVSKLYGVVVMPTTVIVDRRGTIRHLHKGYMPGYEDTYRQQVRSLLEERM